jgi:hypothetical protein
MESQSKRLRPTAVLRKNLKAKKSTTSSTDGNHDVFTNAVTDIDDKLRGTRAGMHPLAYHRK